LPKSFLTEYRLELSVFLGLAFGFLTIVSAVHVWILSGGSSSSNSLPSYLTFLEDLGKPLGTWATWIVVVAPLAFIVCVWWFYDYIAKTRELHDLIDTPSKAKFVRNLDDIEYLAWVLPQRFEDKVLKKKKELKI
jgi:H+/Cl- antiporter ClcA